MRKLIALGIPIAGLLSLPIANADVGGQVPGPGLCEYPGTGVSGMAGALVPGYWYGCDFPTEINGSHWHCEYGGAAGVTQIGAGFSFMMFNAGASLQGTTGGLAGSCSYRCPDMTLAAMPNPPGAWKEHLVASKCITVGPNPDLPPPPPDLPPAPEPIVPAVTNPVFPNPVETQPAPEPLVGPTVTDPTFPNPAATVNSGNG